MVRALYLLGLLGPAGLSQAARLLGRVNPATRQLTWPGTGLSFTFTGTSASVGIEAIHGTNSVQLVIDDKTPIIIANVNGTNISTGTLAKGKHTVELRKRSEASFGDFTLGKVTVVGGALEADKPASRRIQLIGDSITVGYGLDGALPCTNTAALEDAPRTYGALTARNLSADYDIVAWSGIGVTRNYMSTTVDTSPVMPKRWTHYGTNDADNSYTFPAADTPDVVVINLGTNDFSYQGVRAALNLTTFTSAYTAFAKTVQGHYPAAEFFLTSSPLLSDSYPTVADAQHTSLANAAKAVVAALGKKAHFVDFPPQGSDVGCDYHPNANEHGIMASLLTPAIKNALRW